ncbi:MAG: hypothetical protein ACLFUB_10935 [Cyclobacteriaceae bacterium]
MAQKIFLMLGYLLWCVNAFLLNYSLLPHEFFSYSIVFFLAGCLFFLLFFLLHIDTNRQINSETKWLWAVVCLSLPPGALVYIYKHFKSV